MKSLRAEEKNTFWGPDKNWKKAFKTRWTYELFMEGALLVHGDFYDYSSVDKNQKFNNRTKLNILHKTCGEIWSVEVRFFFDHNCRVCTEGLWTLTRFIKYSKAIHGNKYDYSKITEKDIDNQRSHVIIICKDCGHEWSSDIGNHINGGCGCPYCSGRLRWTLERFLKEAKEIHKDKHIYDKITADLIQNCYSYLPIYCTICSAYYTQTITNHIYGKNGCWNCVYELWTLEKFHRLASQIHGKRYDYSLITVEHIQNGSSHVPIKCLKCDCIFKPTILNHINHRSGCPKCNMTKGEIATEIALDMLEIFNVKYQFKFSDYRILRYDFAFYLGNILYLVEYDGTPHFKPVWIMAKHFNRSRHLDIFKTQLAIKRNCRLIRIDYKQLKNVQYHIEQAILQDLPVYYSTPEMYKWIIESPEVELGNPKDFLPKENIISNQDSPDDKDIDISDEQIQIDLEDEETNDHII